MRPSRLLSQRVSTIFSIRMVFDLPDRSLMKALNVTMVLSPGHKFNGTHVLTIERIARGGFLMNSHCLLPTPKLIL